MKTPLILPEQKTNSKRTVKEQNIFYIPCRTMDTEIVTLTRKPRAKPDTKPEIAREKLKEKRERLKKEKDNILIEEAKKRLAEEEVNKKQQEEKIKQEEETKKMNDPMYLMMKQMQEMMSLMKPSQANPIVSAPEPIKKPRASRAKKLPDPEAVISEPLAPKKRVVKPKVEAPPPPKPKAIKKKKSTYYEESPSNVFVGNTRNNIPEPEVKEEEKIDMASSSSALLAQMMRNRRMYGNI